MTDKQLSASVINVAASIGINPRNSAISTINEATLNQQKYAISEENLLSDVCISIERHYFLFCKYVEPSI